MFAFSQNCDPAETGLGTFETEEFKQCPIIVNRYTPFLVMVGLVEGVVATPSIVYFLFLSLIQGPYSLLLS